MKTELTKQDILELFEKQNKNFESLLLKERKERERSHKELDEMLKKREEQFNRFNEMLKKREEQFSKFDDRINKLDGQWSRFVESLVKPGLIDLFSKHDINLRAIYSNVLEFKDKQKYYEIDLLAINDIYAVALEIKTTLTTDDVNEHIERMKKIQELPPRDFNLKGKSLLGAVAGITIKSDADKYAQRCGLFVLMQKGNLLDMVNPVHPKEWKIN